MIEQTQGILSTRNLVFNEKLKYPDIDLVPNETTFICGASGCGKSTLLRLFNATAPSLSGQIYFKGQNIAELDKIGLRRQVILTGQIPYLFRDTIRGNFIQYHQYHESVCPDDSAVNRFLSLCCISFTPDAPCETMSGGERQRIFLAIALTLSPSVLLLDEPTSALDSALSYEVIANIITFCRQHNITLVIVSHDRKLQEKYAEHLIDLP